MMSSRAVVRQVLMRVAPRAASIVRAFGLRLLIPVVSMAACFPNPDDLRPKDTGASGTGAVTGGGGMCQQPGDSCALTVDCCQSGSKASKGAYCISEDNLCHAKCTTGSDCASKCCVSVTGEAMGACAAASECASGAGVGDPCSANGDCASGSCNRWCQATCSATNAVCASTSSSVKNARGAYNWCGAALSGGGSVCYPGCSAASDCTVYGSGVSCRSFTDVTGFTTKVCSP